MAAATAAHSAAWMVGRSVAMLVSWTAAPKVALMVAQTVATMGRRKAVLMADGWAVKMDSSTAAYWAVYSVVTTAVHWDKCSAVRMDAMRAEYLAGYWAEHSVLHWVVRTADARVASMVESLEYCLVVQKAVKMVVNSESKTAERWVA